MTDNIKKILLGAQRNELTEHLIYKKLAKTSKNSHNKEILLHISNDELRHHNFWKIYTKEDVKPKRFKIFLYYLISRILGLTFGLKLMEKGESLAQKNYKKIAETIPEVKNIEEDEHIHEQKIIELLNEERLEYTGSIVLGLNDALVELTGAIAGLTLAFRNTRIVGIAALITGIAAALSMAASEYLSTKTENNNKNPLKASLYTGLAYIITVISLVLPFLLMSNYIQALIITFIIAVLIIFIFNFYTSIAKNLSFKKHFLEMLLLSFGVATLSFIIGFLVRKFLNINI